jgi:hypothetical protein
LHLESRGTAFVGIFAEQDFLQVTKRCGRVCRFEVGSQATQVLAYQLHIVVNDEDTVAR